MVIHASLLKVQSANMSTKGKSRFKSGLALLDFRLSGDVQATIGQLLQTQSTPPQLQSEMP